MQDIVNLQRKIAIDVRSLRSFIARLMSDPRHENGKVFSVAFISDRRMKQLNGLFRGKDATTDVLSFPHEPEPFDPQKDNLGDIVISAEQAQRQAAENGLSLENELQQLILHGYLHLCGMDHESDNGEMNERELVMRKSLSI